MGEYFLLEGGLIPGYWCCNYVDGQRDLFLPLICVFLVGAMKIESSI